MRRPWLKLFRTLPGHSFSIFISLVLHFFDLLLRLHFRRSQSQVIYEILEQIEERDATKKGSDSRCYSTEALSNCQFLLIDNEYLP